MDILSSAYPWIKAAHVIVVVAWMAGLFYLPRLFVYHAEASPGSDTVETLKVMERRLLKGIMNPAMLLAWGLGIVLALTPGALDWTGDGWFHAKLACVVILTWFHLLCGRWRKEFETGRSRRTSRFFRIVNEVPTVILIAVVVLVIVRPF